MSTPRSNPIDFPPIQRHGVIGDRRTAALVAADGTINWFCAPDFDGSPIFGSLLDPVRGGYCRFGPQEVSLGRQSYRSDTLTLVTRWAWPASGSEIELSDIMARPEAERPQAERAQRIIIRLLKVTGDAAPSFQVHPRRNFAAAQTFHPTPGGAAFTFPDGVFSLWTSFPVGFDLKGASTSFAVCDGDEHWAVLGWNVPLENWSAAQAARTFADAQKYWRDWSEELTIKEAGSRTPALRRAALTVQVLSHAHHDCAAAAPTTSLPERLGGDRNYDYRYAWVRDASLSLALLARMGKTQEVERYLHWLCRLSSATDAPLQVCYRLDGDPQIDQEDIPGVVGYAHSQPVRRGNRAAKQRQLGSLGYFADCARIYVDHGGEWRDEFQDLLRRAADSTCEHWQEKDSGVWELPQEAHYVASRVMCWVVLERAIYIAGRTGQREETDRWRQTAAMIHAEVMEQGWCEEKNSFRQRYGSDALDAAALLIPLMNFLPVDHPRVVGTLNALTRELVVDGLIHRFDPTATLGGKRLPIGLFEGAFLPCVFWHAQTLAKAGRCDEAEAILRRCEAIAGDVGLFAEEADARHNTFLGNTPLLFSHVEYARAVVALNQARDRAGQSAAKETL